jgi:eukaryotic-like serine/threonine-protein kinase
MLESAGIARYVQTGSNRPVGYLVYYEPRTASLLAVSFDVSRTVTGGTPTRVLDSVLGTVGPFGLFALSAGGALAYVRGTVSESTIVWVDRAGKETPLPAPARNYGIVRISPDGHRLAMSIFGETDDIWIYDLDRGTFDKLTTGNSGSPIWTSDGRRVIYGRHPAAGAALVSIPTDGSAGPTVLATYDKGRIFPTSTSLDGRVIGFYASNPEIWTFHPDQSAAGLRALQLSSDSRARGSPVFSPDGKWIAYRSAESGRSEIYVSPYPATGGRIPVSTDGGLVPQWSATGRELFYRSGDKMMVVDVAPGPSFQASRPRMLFDRRYELGYDVARDGRFLMLKPPATPAPGAERLYVVLNWAEELRRLVLRADSASTTMAMDRRTGHAATMPTQPLSAQ